MKAPRAKQPPEPESVAVANIVRRFAAVRGYGPTIPEIGREMGVPWHRALRAVKHAEQVGTIERRARCPRAIRAVDAPGRRRT